jgi:hypothetical protein
LKLSFLFLYLKRSGKKTNQKKFGKERKRKKTKAMPISRQEFESYFPRLVDDLVAHAQQYGAPEDCINWYRHV